MLLSDGRLSNWVDSLDRGLFIRYTNRRKPQARYDALSQAVSSALLPRHSDNSALLRNINFSIGAVILVIKQMQGDDKVHQFDCRR